MKPKLFIGSSVEGLNIAYSIHQNLRYDAEVTVWDQGVFELSATAIESLTKAVCENDFAVFVFNADDALVVRGNNQSAVRDNVIFELGLFIGRLGRERVFIVAPLGSDLHIPSDLLGINPGTYETNRSDGSFQAATAPSCYQIKQQIKRLGCLDKAGTSSENPLSIEKDEDPFFHWYLEIVEKRYDSALSAIQKEKEGKVGGKFVDLCAWEMYANMKKDNRFNVKDVEKFVTDNADFVESYIECASICRKERYYEDAIKIMLECDAKFPDNQKVRLALAISYESAEDFDEAIKTLKESNPTSDTQIAIALANNLEKKELTAEAFSVIEHCLADNQGEPEIRYKYAMLAKANKLEMIALGVLHELTIDFPKSCTYWGYLGNTCLDAGLHDNALYAYRRAEKATDSSESPEWIVSNIGNLLNNKELPTEAIGYFQKALESDPQSEYAHNRLASAMKKKEESDKVYKKKCSEGLLEMRKRIRAQQTNSTNECS